MTGQLVTIIGSSESLAFTRTVRVSKDSTFIKERVSKGDVHLCAYSGIADMVSINNTLSIPIGKECDSLYMCSYDLLCKGESAAYSLPLHKQYSEITVKFADAVDEVFPYEILVKGNISGVDIFSLNPIPGKFEYKPAAKGEFGREFTVRVPRQIDNSLIIEVWDKDKYLSTLELGKEIENKGFNWRDEDLNDIAVEIDYSHSEMSVKVIEWQDSIDKDLVI